jgi:hypothetical protein
MKVLIAIPNPREISDSLDSIKKLPCDKLYVQYYKEYDALKIIRDFFLSHIYTHLAILPDDIVVKVSDCETLINDIISKDYPVISGLMNMHYESNDYNIAWTLMGPGWYFWTDKDLEKGGIQCVEFSGFPFMFIRRDVVEQIPFRGMQNVDGFRYSFDLAFAFDCYNHIPRYRIYVDTRVKLLHLKYRKGYEVYEKMLVGIRKPGIVYVPA